MKVTTPKEMESGLAEFEKAVAAFEEFFAQEEKGLNFYHLVIKGELNRNIIDRVKKVYEDAGWRVLDCKTSSESGEKPGLTGLQLERKSETMTSPFHHSYF